MTEARVVASTALEAAGLHRLAALAAVPLDSDPARTSVTLRSVEEAPTGAAVDVAVGANEVVVTVQTVPDETTWTAVLRLLTVLLDPTPPV